MKLREGIIVKAIKYQENSKIITLITENGKESIILKGATNLKGHTFSYSQELTKISYDTQKNYFRAGKVLNQYSQIHNNIDKLHSSLKIIEIADVLTEHINDFKIFYRFLSKILSLINDFDECLLFELTFRIKILYLLGIAPVFTRCVNCGQQENLISFSLYSGGMKCQECFDNDQLFTLDCINIIKTLYLSPLKSIVKKRNSIKYNYQDVNLFLNMYYEYYLGFKSKVENVLKKL